MTIPSNWEEPSKVAPITSCKQAARLVSISFERKLTFREWLAMRLHLLSCKTCTFYGRQIKALRQIFISHERALDNIPCSCDEALPSQSKDRMKEMLKKQL